MTKKGGKIMFEVEFVTTVNNEEDTDGHWFNYYTAESEQEAVDKFQKDMESSIFENVRIIKVSKV